MLEKAGKLVLEALEEQKRQKNTERGKDVEAVRNGQNKNRKETVVECQHLLGSQRAGCGTGPKSHNSVRPHVSEGRGF